MARIEPVPMDDLPQEAQDLLAQAIADGLYSQTVMARTLAYRGYDRLLAQLRSDRAAWAAAHGPEALLEPRLVELVRIRSAQVNDCVPCTLARKEQGTVSEEDLLCFARPGDPLLSQREWAAVKLMEMISLDHMSIGDDLFRELAAHFTPAEIVELFTVCGSFLAGHRVSHCFRPEDTESPPLITYRASLVGARTADVAQPASR